MVFCTHFKQILHDSLIGSNGTSVFFFFFFFFFLFIYFFFHILQATVFIVCEWKDFL